MGHILYIFVHYFAMGGVLVERFYPVYSNEKRKDPSAQIPSRFIKRRISVHSVIGTIDNDHDRSFSFPGEAHPFWEMVYVVEGCVGVTADDRIYVLSAGDLIVHKPMEFHKIWSEDDHVRVNIYTFDASGTDLTKLENHSGAVNEIAEKQLHDLNLIAKQAFVCDDGGLVMNFRDPVKAQIFVLMLEALLLELDKNTNEIDTQEKYSHVFSTVVAFMNDNIQRHLTVEQIARQCNISSSMLKKLFRKYTDSGVMAYFSRMKINRAMEMLDAGSSVATVSEKLAYANQFYFSTSFKRQTGYTPMEYKKMGLQSHKE